MIELTPSTEVRPVNATADGKPAQQDESLTARQFRRSTALKALGAALVGGALAGNILPQLAAAKSHRKKRRPKRRPKRLPMSPPTIWTQTFTNRDEIHFGRVGPADTYPSRITVSGLANARILDVNVLLHDLRHDRPSDVAVMLASPGGKAAVVMHNAGGDRPSSGVVLVLDDQAAVPMPHETDARFMSGTYRPTSIGSAFGVFPPPALQTVNNSALSIFNGENPNGEWRLYTADDSPQNDGLLVTGWSLVLVYELPGTPLKRPRPKPPRKRRPKHRKARR